jgi:hypothetical protein
MHLGKQCNHALGQHYENDAAPLIGPMIEGDPTTLSPEHQSTISLWAIKNLLIHRLAKPHPEDTGMTEKVRDLLNLMVKSPSMPESPIVRIGALEIPRVPGFARKDLHPDMSLPKVPLFGVHQLGWVVLEAAIADRSVMEPYVNLSPDNPALVRIWPTKQEDIDWPPSALLTSVDIHRLRQAWAGGVWPPSPNQRIDLPGMFRRRSEFKPYSAKKNRYTIER